MSVMDLFKPKEKEVFEKLQKEAKEITPPSPPEPDEWAWVEGYKGTDANMQCHGFQYELNKEHCIEGEVVLCRNGFHYCRKLEDVFNYYSLYDSSNNRFFKVKALINLTELKRKQERDKEERNRYYSSSSFYHSPIMDTKFVAKKIILHIFLHNGVSIHF